VQFYRLYIKKTVREAIEMRSAHLKEEFGMLKGESEYLRVGGGRIEERMKKEIIGSERTCRGKKILIQGSNNSHSLYKLVLLHH